ncbi:MFS transporter [Candidatus Sumerlaeota bacterium]|nr:MFS transporter [Candidatus Sumerlaeota bacterium]
MWRKLFSDYRELRIPARQFLFFACVNVISWQLTIGIVLPLFARHIGMPQSWVGVLLALTPLSSLLVLATLELVETHGPRRVMIWAWLGRTLGITAVFLIPWAAGRYGESAGWHVLLAATGLFCFFRAFGVGGWFPWIHELVPRRRGVYFSVETKFFQFISIAILVAVSAYLGHDATTARYLFVYGVGICGGLAALLLMLRIPGGRRTPHPEHDAEMRELRSYRAVLRDRNFMRFVLQAAMTLSALNWLGAVAILYLRDIMHFSDGQILRMSAFGSVMVALTISPWSRFAEAHGSGQTLFMTAASHSLGALCWIGLWPEANWAVYASGAVLALTMTFGAAYMMSVNRGMLGYVPEHSRAAYTNVWIVAISLALGVTPILAGQVIEYGGLWGFRACFLVSGIAGLVCATQNFFLPDDGDAKARRDWIAHPAQPVRTLARIAWITLGLDETNRPADEDGDGQDES